MFYDVFISLCEKKGISPNKALTDCGVSRTSTAKWREGATPRGVTLQKLADYFDVTTDYLLTGEEAKKAPTSEGERIPHRDKRELLAGQGVSILLDADAKLTDEQLDDIVNFIQFQQEKNGR